MGRKNLSSQRREEILVTMAKCIDRYGLAGSTMARVAKELGVHRTLICHYFGTRSALITALLERQVKCHMQLFLVSVENTHGATRLTLILDYLFSGPMIETNDLVFQGEIYALSGRDSDIRKKVRTMYEAFLQITNNELELIFPNAPLKRRKEVAYNLICLAEQNCVMNWLELPEANTSYARFGAETPLMTLEE